MKELTLYHYNPLSGRRDNVTKIQIHNPCFEEWPPALEYQGKNFALLLPGRYIQVLTLSITEPWLR